MYGRSIGSRIPLADFVGQTRPSCQTQRSTPCHAAAAAFDRNSHNRTNHFADCRVSHNRTGPSSIRSRRM